MKSKTRSRLILLALGGIVATGASLLVLRAARPIYYTDGQQASSAVDLRDASMLAWSSPEPVVELPGPVQGRVATLADGRLLYGRKVGARTVLVVFDPKRPELEPLAAIGLGSAGHDLAPALAADGRLYFASDRPGGHGGFDIWVARVRGASFGDVECLGDAVNTSQDETDPAPDPVSSRLAFVRRDPAKHDGRNGVLMLASLAAEDPAIPVIADAPARGRIVIDRDPAFSADGSSLWFARQERGGAPQVYRTWQHAPRTAESASKAAADAKFVRPVPVAALDGRTLRAPQPSADGFGVTLLDQHASMLYLSRAFEVYPWWDGQWRLELILLSSLGFCALLLLLLALGGRWNKLDIITQCLLASFLLHLLILLWMMRVEIVRQWIPPSTDRGGAVQVRLLSGVESESGNGNEVSQLRSDLAREQSFAGVERALAAEQPGDMLAKVERGEPKAATGSHKPLARARSRQATASLADRPTAATRRDGADVARPVQAHATRTEAQALQPSRSAKPRVAASELAVRIPSAQSLASGRSTASRRLPAEGVPAAGLAAARPATSTHAWSTPEPRAQDLPAAPSRRTGAAPAERVLARNARAATVAASASATARPERVVRPAALGSADTAPGPRSAAAALRRAGPSPAPRDEYAPASRATLSSKLAALRDAPEPAPQRVGTLAGEREIARDLARTALAIGAQSRGPHAPVKASEPELAGVAGDPSLMRPDTSLERAARVRRAAVAAEKPMLAAGGLAPQVGVGALIRDDVGDVGTVARSDSAVARESELRQLDATTGRAEFSAADAARRAERSAASNLVATPQVARVQSALDSAERRSLPPEAERGIGAPTGGPRAFAAEVAVRDDLAGSDAPVAARTAGVGAARQALLAAPVEIDGPAELSPAPPRRLVAAPSPRVFGQLTVPGTYLDRVPRRDFVPAIPDVQRKRVADSLYANRFGERKAEALERFGGTVETERAVRMGLRYLASIQNPDGSWGSAQRMHRKYGEVYVGKTGLCVLAFLGAGHTPKSRTKYSRNVQRALDLLVSTQDPVSGHFGVTSAYSHGVATYAIAECYAMTHDASLLQPLREAVAHTLSQQHLRGRLHSRGGWGYFSPRLRPEDHYARASTSSWQIMGLESARRSGIQVPDEALARARRFLLNMFDARRGWFYYTKEPSRLRMDWPTLPASTPASVFCLLLLGVDPDREAIERGLAYTVRRRPQRYGRASDDDFVLKAAGNVYFWYYGSLACFFAGGDAWTRWNSALKRVLPRAQSADGSFRPIDPYAEYAGDHAGDKSYTTAMCVLSLEVYYRYFTPLLKKR